MFAIFTTSLILNMSVLERGGAFLNYVRLFGTSGNFLINGGITLFAGVVGLFGLISAFFIYRLTLSTFVIRRHLIIVSSYLNAITLATLIVMAVSPTVGFQ